MYERHKRRYSLCDISKVDRTVDVVLLKVRGHSSYIPKPSGSFICLNPIAGPLAAPCGEKGWEVYVNYGEVEGGVGDFKVL